MSRGLLTECGLDTLKESLRDETYRRLDSIFGGIANLSPAASIHHDPENTYHPPRHDSSITSRDLDCIEERLCRTTQPMFCHVVKPWLLIQMENEKLRTALIALTDMRFAVQRTHLSNKLRASVLSS